MEIKAFMDHYIIGQEDAKIIMESGVTLEEYLGILD